MKSQTTLETAEPRICFSYARVSSDRQTDDDATGIDRQLETARRVVAMHPGWTLDDTLSIADLGLSGFSGKNLTDTTKLGALLKALREGKIPKGRIMIIEALDRLTRLEVDEAYDLFRDILRGGLEIYVDRGSRHYTKDSLKSPTDLIITIVELAAGNEYSAKISGRVKDAWKIKKQRFLKDGKPYKTKPYGWLKWDADIDDYDSIPEKVKSLDEAFALALQGLGVRTIAKRLTKEGATLLSEYNGKKVKSHVWSNTTVAKLFRNKAVLGYNKDGIKMYPEVIKPEVYYAAKAKVDERRKGRYYGRTTGAKNLFIGLTQCAECEYRLYLHTVPNYTIMKKLKAKPHYGERGGAGVKGGEAEHLYLHCGGYAHGICKTHQTKYNFFEESFINAVSCSVASLTLADSKKASPEGKDTETLKGQLAETRQLLGRYTADYEEAQKQGLPAKPLFALMNKTEAEEETLLAELESATTIELGTTPLSEAKKELMALMYKDWSVEDTRLRARELIRTLVEKIVVHGRSQSYVIHWKGPAKQTHVILMKKGWRLAGYKIDNVFFPSMGKDWKLATADIARYAKDVEAKPLPKVA